MFNDILKPHFTKAGYNFESKCPLNFFKRWMVTLGVINMYYCSVVFKDASCYSCPMMKVKRYENPN